MRLGWILPRLPRDDRFDRELRQRLQPGQDRQRQPLRDQKLRGLGAPGDGECGKENAGERPDRR